MRWVVILLLLLTLGCVQERVDEKTSTWEQTIIEDVKHTYPHADVVEIEDYEDFGDYYLVNVRVSFDVDTPCPTRMRIRYRYPAYGYEPSIPKYIVKDCQFVCDDNCMIAYEEQAIVAAHTLSETERVQEFIDDNTKASASFDEEEKVWRVVFTKGNSSMTVLISPNPPTVVSIE